MEVTGPISSLPGRSHVVPEGTMCDEHPEILATHRIQGETDSFGAELNDMCDECHSAYLQSKADIEGQCQNCGIVSTAVRPIRDWTEGSCGPVYHYCASCRSDLLNAIDDDCDDEDDWDDYVPSRDSTECAVCGCTEVDEASWECPGCGSI